MQTFVRVREQIHSNLLGLHIDALSGLTNDRLLAYRSALDTRTSDLAQSAARGTRLLANAVAQQASILSYIDGFTFAAAGAFLCLLLAAIMRPTPPSPF